MSLVAMRLLDAILLDELFVSTYKCSLEFELAALIGAFPFPLRSPALFDS